MRFQVPQFIDIEDKVIGPFTLKQFGAYLIAVLALIPIYTIVNLGVFVTIAIPSIGLAVLFAHGKFYGQPFGSMLINAVFFMTGERSWIWRRGKHVTGLKIVGAEYEDFDEISSGPTSSLGLVAQSLMTAGSITTEDEADPMLEDAIDMPAPKEKKNSSDKGSDNKK